MILAIVAILIVLWLLGLLVNVGGGFIHLLVIIAIGVFIWDHLVKGRGEI